MEMMMKRTTKLRKMREWVIANPNAKSADFVKATGGSKTQFYYLRTHYGVSKKRKTVPSAVEATTHVDTYRPAPSIDATLQEVRKLLSEAKYMASISVDLTSKASALLGESNAATV